MKRICMLLTLMLIVMVVISKLSVTATVKSSEHLQPVVSTANTAEEVTNSNSVKSIDRIIKSVIITFWIIEISLGLLLLSVCTYYSRVSVRD